MPDKVPVVVVTVSCGDEPDRSMAETVPVTGPLDVVMLTLWPIKPMDQVRAILRLAA